MNFTPEQQTAIDLTDRDILVSAAAGSGKTAVLTERVIKKLTGNNPVMANTLVIVTYTVAAAAELRERIHSSLLSLIEKNPTNKLLSSQLLLLEKARISTIHSLCSGLIRENFYDLNLELNVGFRMMDENELSILKKQVIEDYFEERYNEKNSAFLELVEFFCYAEDTPLVNLVTKLYDYILSFSQPFLWLDTALDKLSGIECIKDYCYYNVLKSTINEKLAIAISLYRQGIALMGDDEKLVKAYKSAFLSDIVVIEQARDRIMSDDYNGFSKLLQSFVPARLGGVRGFEDKELQESIKTCRENAKSVIKKVVSDFCFDEAEFVEQVSVLHRHTSVLFGIVKDIYNEIARVKLAKNALDYSDLEHFTLKLLSVEDDNGQLQKSNVATSLSEGISEIMVDECQDINDVQNTIFTMLSRGDNLFMVGDVKQSIYRFRKAMPQLFIDKRNRQPVYSPSHQSNEADPTAVTILLKNNFRSRDSVTDSVNALFRQIMCSEVGEVIYNDDECLIPAAHFPEYKESVSELHIVSQQYIGEDESDEQSDTSRISVDAAYIAELIDGMVRSEYKVTDKRTGKLRPCSYKDFAILLRSTKGKSESYIKALGSRGIDGFCSTSSGYFNTNEVSLILSLLRVIDNPLRDFHLLAVLLSPIFSFSPDEVASLRLVDRGATLYGNLKALAFMGDEKASYTLSLIDRFRQEISISSVDQLIESIYTTTDILAIMEATNYGSQKGVNLRLLLDYSRAFLSMSDSSFSGGGLVGFLRYIDRCIDEGKDFDGANTVSESADVVQIVTIHSTKGLEYPICILADCAKKFNFMDLNERYQLNSEYGFCMNYKDEEYNKEVKPVHLNLIKEKARLETISEEQRLLYVAMTRAREKLIMVVTCKDGEALCDNWEGRIKGEDKKRLSLSILSSATSFADWIIPAYLRDPSTVNIIHANPKAVTEDELNLTKSYTSLPDPETISLLKHRLGYEYPYLPITDVVAKVTVTTLAKSKSNSLIEFSDMPEFMREQTATPAQKGTALHAFMQYADLFSDDFTLQGEFTRLVEQRFITPHDLELIDCDKVTMFLQSDIYKRMRSSKRLMREYSFIYEINPYEVASTLPSGYEDEMVVTQGIADCVFFEESGIVILDYKTDKTHDEKLLIERYYNQMRYYKDALEKIFSLPVKECILYSLEMGKAINVAIKN